VDIRSVLDKVQQFFREVKVELFKITWPARKETVASTYVVLIIVVIIALVLGVVDVGLSRMVKLILG
jgi:preprotein translocase subunit SecE